MYLTGDFGSSSAELEIIDPEKLLQAALPAGWDVAAAERDYCSARAAKLLEDTPLFDEASTVAFKGSAFLFTGKFSFGTRQDCRRAVTARGGTVPDLDIVSHSIDYLVVGESGSPQWKHESYGSKIATAVVERSVHGKPAIIGEAQIVSYLT